MERGRDEVERESDTERQKDKIRGGESNKEEADI